MHSTFRASLVQSDVDQFGQGITIVDADNA